MRNLQLTEDLIRRAENSLSEQTREQAENSAFERIFQGYERVPTENWYVHDPQLLISFIAIASLHGGGFYLHLSARPLSFSTFCESLWAQSRMA